MSIKIMSLIWEAGPKQQSERFVLLALADFANDAGECWPSISSVAQKTCLSERGVQKIIRALEDDGWLTTQVGGGRGGANAYRINPERGSGGVNDVRGERGSGGVNGTTERVNGTTENPERGSPKPSRTTKEPPVRPGDDDPMAFLRSVVSEQTAQAFIEHRRAKRAKLTAQAAKMIAAKLAGRSDADEIIRTSIMNGWTGVFPEKAPRPKDDYDFWTGPQLN